MFMIIKLGPLKLTIFMLTSLKKYNLGQSGFNIFLQYSKQPSKIYFHVHYFIFQVDNK